MEAPPPLPPPEDTPQPPLPPPSMQTSNSNTKRLDFVSGAGGSKNIDSTPPPAKRPRVDAEEIKSEEEEGEIIEEDLNDFNSRASYNQITSPKSEIPKNNTSSQCPFIKPESSSKKLRVADSSIVDNKTIIRSANPLFGDLKKNSTAQLRDDRGSDIENLLIGQGFDIIDDVGSDDDDGQAGYDSDDDLDEDEVDAMLDENLKKPAQDEDGFTAPSVREKVVLKERGNDPFDILPEGWVLVTHDSGMPIYLHRASRVCTLSRPYFLGPGSARRHDVPISAIPCLQYRKAKLSISTHQENTTAENEDSKEELVNGVEDSSLLDTKPDSCTTEKDNLNNCDKNESSIAKNDGENVCEVEESMDVTADTDAHTSSSKAEKDDASKPKNAVVKVDSIENYKKTKSLAPHEVRTYCENLFEFEKITVKKFKTWRDRRKHIKQLKKNSIPTLPSNTKLITCSVLVNSPSENNSTQNNRKKEFVLNPANKSEVSILHEYIQHALRLQPKYIFKELENAKTPYSATVVIDNVEYGTGYGANKKLAKAEAAKVTLAVLIPELKNATQENLRQDIHDLSFFDEVKIEDPRICHLCNMAGQPSPFQILGECLKRNYGMGDTNCQMSMNALKHQRSEFTMKVGKHTATVICKNKREGKQLAAQAILQKMHPHIPFWGSLLRLYGTDWKAIKEKEEASSVTTMSSKHKSYAPNYAILSKLRKEMTKLQMRQESCGISALDLHINESQLLNAMEEVYADKRRSGGEHIIELAEMIEELDLMQTGKGCVAVTSRCPLSRHAEHKDHILKSEVKIEENFGHHSIQPPIKQEVGSSLSSIDGNKPKIKQEMLNVSDAEMQTDIDPILDVRSIGVGDWDVNTNIQFKLQAVDQQTQSSIPKLNRICQAVPVCMQKQTQTRKSNSNLCMVLNAPVNIDPDLGLEALRAATITHQPIQQQCTIDEETGAAVFTIVELPFQHMATQTDMAGYDLYHRTTQTEWSGHHLMHKATQYPDKICYSQDQTKHSTAALGGSPVDSEIVAPAKVVASRERSPGPTLTAQPISYLPAYVTPAPIQQTVMHPVLAIDNAVVTSQETALKGNRSSDPETPTAGTSIQTETSPEKKQLGSTEEMEVAKSCVSTPETNTAAYLATGDGQDERLLTPTMSQAGYAMLQPNMYRYPAVMARPQVYQAGRMPVTYMYQNPMQQYYYAQQYQQQYWGWQ